MGNIDGAASQREEARVDVEEGREGRRQVIVRKDAWREEAESDKDP